ncbi:MAG: hypothetical protein LDLANPLL_01484 [Turneriella sp.]|nr:hypothetical protein [Turneriella sp.]
MNVYVDSSWLLRILLRQSSVRPLPADTKIYSSALLFVECRRTLERHLKQKRISSEFYQSELDALQNFLEAIQIVELDKHIVRRAAEPFLLPIGTLDALHLATALALSHSEENPIHFATFDSELALAASAHGFSMIRE